MTVRSEQGILFLEGRCLVEDAEELLRALRDEPLAQIDLTGVQRMHLAVAQVVLALRPSPRGTPANAFLAAHVFRGP